MDSAANIDRELNRAEEEIQVALDAFRKAQRLRLREWFRLRGGDTVTEEVYVSHGLSAVFRAERAVAQAARTIDALPEGDPARVAYAGRVTEADTCFRRTLQALRSRPDPVRLVRDLKQVRRSLATRGPVPS